MVKKYRRYIIELEHLVWLATQGDEDIVGGVDDASARRGQTQDLSLCSHQKHSYQLYRMTKKSGLVLKLC